MLRPSSYPQLRPFITFMAYLGGPWHKPYLPGRVMCQLETTPQSALLPHHAHFGFLSRSFPTSLCHKNLAPELQAVACWISPKRVLLSHHPCRNTPAFRKQHKPCIALSHKALICKKNPCVFYRSVKASNWEFLRLYKAPPISMLGLGLVWAQP